MKRRDILKILGFTTWGATAHSAVRLFPYIDEYGRIYSGAGEYEHALPGRASWYATTCRECPDGCGILVKVRDGRAVKVEGNPAHPLSQGGLCALGQASLQGLYHPRRFKGPMLRRSGTLEPAAWDEAVASLNLYFRDLAKKGRQDRVAFITGAIGPSMARVIDRFLAGLGAPPRITFEPLGDDAWREANRQCFGAAEIPAVDLEAADMLLCFSSDFIEAGPSRVEMTRQLARARKRWGKGEARFVHLGPRLGLTAANADEWIPIRPGSEAALAMAMVGVIAREWKASPDMAGSLDDFKKTARITVDQAARISGVPTSRIEELAKRFAAARPGVALAGQMAGDDPQQTWRTVNLLNSIAGNFNRTIRFGSGLGVDRASANRISDLAGRMADQEVESLFVYGVDPFLDLNGRVLAGSVAKVPLKISFSTCPDGWSDLADLVLPSHHFLESWDDYSPSAGIDGLVTPAMRPLYDTRHPGDVIINLAAAMDEAGEQDGDRVEGDGGERAAPERTSPFLDVLESNWREKYFSRVEGHAQPWAAVRRQGGVFSSPPERSVALLPGAFTSPLTVSEKNDAGPVLVTFPSALQYDGRGADRPWLREVADPVSRIAWDPWAEINPATAGGMGVSSGDLVEIRTRHGSGTWPVRVRSGIAPGVVAAPLSPVFEMEGGVRGNALDLLEPGSGVRSWMARGVTLSPLGGRRAVPTVQPEESQHGRGIARDTEFHDPHHDREQWKEEHARQHPPRENMYPEHSYPGHKWGMAVDLDRCVGCGACAVACYAENNLPVVGRDLVLERREMAWLRIERFYVERDQRIVTSFIPVMCQQCDNAPCESVCPVFATYHNPEGLNAQVYNRCIGTRFCSNNCPYKVRRFNWFTYQWEEPLNLQLNPEVTVRTKGVMEKCNFCVQRIVEKKHQARMEGREITDGEIQPACAQSCPARAIIFGDLNDHESAVARLTRSGRAYQVLGDLNTRPAVTYLARVARK